MTEAKTETALSSECWLKFWGVRGSIPTPGPATVHYGGNTSCVEVRADGQLIILDAGTGIRPLGLALAQEFKKQPMDITLLITHTHWDHIQGFPFFLPAYDAANKVQILGYEGARSSLAGTIAGQMESPYFPIALQQMPGNISIRELKDFVFKVGSVEVRACTLNHPGIAVGYRLFTSGGSIAYLPDNEPFGKSWVCEGESKSSLDQKVIDFLRDVDVLITDSQYDDAEYANHVGWGHGCVSHVVEMALAAGAKRLYLFHHDPNHDDQRVSELLERARQLVVEKGGTLEVEAAREGEKVVLK